MSIDNGLHTSFDVLIESEALPAPWHGFWEIFHAPDADQARAMAVEQYPAYRITSVYRHKRPVTRRAA